MAGESSADFQQLRLLGTQRTHFWFKLHLELLKYKYTVYDFYLAILPLFLFVGSNI